MTTESDVERTVRRVFWTAVVGGAAYTALIVSGYVDGLTGSNDSTPTESSIPAPNYPEATSTSDMPTTTTVPGIPCSLVELIDLSPTQRQQAGFDEAQGAIVICPRADMDAIGDPADIEGMEAYGGCKLTEQNWDITKTPPTGEFIAACPPAGG